MLANSLELQDMMDLYLKQGITAIDVVSEYIGLNFCLIFGENDFLKVF